MYGERARGLRPTLAIIPASRVALLIERALPELGRRWKHIFPRRVKTQFNRRDIARRYRTPPAAQIAHQDVLGGFIIPTLAPKIPRLIKTGPFAAFTQRHTNFCQRTPS